MEKFRDSSLSPKERAEDLLGRLTLAEKVGQVNQKLLGFNSYERKGEEFELTQECLDEIEKYGGLGVMYGLFRADPWSKKNWENGAPPKYGAKLHNLLQKTVTEKSRFGIPALMSSECPHGHQALGGYLLPVALAMGATFNTALVESGFEVVGKQLSDLGVDFALVSMLDVLRDPRWGRSEECFSEDAQLCSEMAVAAIKGCKKQGVEVVSKHMCAQGETTGGVNASSARIGIKELEEVHLPPIAASVEAGAYGFMAAYNDINGVPCHANPQLLRDYLRGELGFDGVVMADGTAIDRLDLLTGDNALSGALALESGVDISLWDTAFSHLEEAVERGAVSEKLLDEAVLRVLELKFERGLFENPYLDESFEQDDFEVEDYPQSLELARESAVLLKNENILPFEDNDIKSIAVIGPNADSLMNQLGDYTPPIDASKAHTLLGGLEEACSARGIKLSHSEGSQILEGTDEQLKEAVRIAKESDVIVLSLGGSSNRFGESSFDVNGAAIISDHFQMDCGEGVDAADIRLPKCQRKLAKKIFKLGKPVVAVINAGRPYVITDIDEHADAVLYSFYPGPFGGKALAEIIFGDVSPSGRLSASLPANAGQIPCYHDPQMGYQAMTYHDTDGKPLYTFGAGLGYTGCRFTGFEWSGDKVEFEVENIGDRDGCIVPMLYRQKIGGNTVGRARELCAFDKIFLASKEKKTVTLEPKRQTHLGVEKLHDEDGVRFWIEENCEIIWESREPFFNL